MPRILTLLLILQVAFLRAALTNSIPLDCNSFGVPAVHDGYLYLPVEGTLSAGFAVFSLADPRSPQFAGYAQTLSTCKSAPLFHGDTAYFSTSHGVELFDITNPEMPAKLRTLCPLRQGSAPAGIDLHDGSLTVNSAGKTYVYDLSDVFAPLMSDVQTVIPPAPQPASTNQVDQLADTAEVNCAETASVTTNQSNSVVHGVYRYVADNGTLSLQTLSARAANADLLSSIDIEPKVRIVPLAPTNSISCATSNCVMAARNGKLLLHGDTLFTFTGCGCSTNGAPRSELAAFDVSDGSSPRRLGSIELDGHAMGLCDGPESNLLFVADGFRLYAVRMLGNESLTNAASIETSRNFAYGTQSVTVTDNGTVLAACGADGIKAYSFGGTNFEFKALGTTGGFASDIAYEKGTCFVADAMGGITRLKFADGAFKDAKTFSMPVGSAVAVKAKNGIAYAAGGELPVVTLLRTRPLHCADRADETELCRGAFARDISLFTARGRNYAAIADSRNGVSVFDISDPKRPIFASSPLRRSDGTQFAGEVIAALHANDRLFILDGKLGLICITD